MIQRLIQEYIPNGVEYKALGEVVTFNRGTAITQKDIQSGEIPVIAGGQKPAYYGNKSNREGETIVIAGSGTYAGFVSFWDKPIFVSDAFSVDTKQSDVLITRYLYHFLLNEQNNIYAKKKGSGVPHIYGKDLANIKIPIPPIAVQNKIVSILDKFTELIDSLKIELSLRKKQYEYYREKLLNVENVEWKRLGDICNMQAGKAISASNISIKQTSEYKYPCYGGNGLRGYVARYNQEGSYPLIGRQGAFCGNVQFASGKFYATEHAIIVSQKISFNAKYLYYLLKVAKLNQYKTAGAQPGLSVAKLNAITVSILPLKEQERIVAILDKFDALCNDIYAEIELRKKQYEYYRDKLLQFEICNI